MTTQPEALRLAAEMDQYLYSAPAHPLCTDAAAELRRLHAENERLHQINCSHEVKLSVRGYEIQIADLEAQRDALLAEHQQTLALQQRSYEREIQLEVEAEREACAKVCEGRTGGAVRADQWWNGFKEAMRQCAAAIRARGNT